MNTGRKQWPARTRRTILLSGVLLVWMLIAPATLFAADGNLYALISGQVQVIDPNNGQVVATIDVQGSETVGAADGVPTALYPTPGGKFIFVTYSNSNMLAVIDFDSRRVERTIALPGNSPPSGLYFSPRGENLYATYTDDSVLALFAHKRANFTPLEQLNLGTAGRQPIVFNRRGTRLYLHDEAGLTYYLRKTHEPFNSVRRTNHIEVWAIDPDFRNLWGVGQEGAVAVDERRVRVRKRFDGAYIAVEPQFAPRAGRAYLLGDGGMRIEGYNLRNYKPAGTLDLPSQAVDMAIDEDETLWIADSSGTLYAADPQLEGLRRVVNLGGKPLDIDYVILQSGEGFACF